MAGYNPNRKKKTYSFNRSQSPKIVSASINGLTEYFDLTNTTVERPFYYENVPERTGEIPVFYDEDLIIFNNQDEVLVTFNLTFPDVPAITLEMITEDEQSNVSIFIREPTATSFIACASAPFVGQMVYRAVATRVYPVEVHRTVLSSSFTYILSAKKLYVGNYDSIELPYASFGSSPTQMFITTVDEGHTGTADLVIVGSGSYGLTQTEVSFSAPVYSTVNYLAIK